MPESRSSRGTDRDRHVLSCRLWQDSKGAIGTQIVHRALSSAQGSFSGRLLRHVLPYCSQKDSIKASTLTHICKGFATTYKEGSPVTRVRSFLAGVVGIVRALRPLPVEPHQRHYWCRCRACVSWRLPAPLPECWLADHQQPQSNQRNSSRAVNRLPNIGDGGKLAARTCAYDVAIKIGDTAVRDGTAALMLSRRARAT